MCGQPNAMALSGPPCVLAHPGLVIHEMSVSDVEFSFQVVYYRTVQRIRGFAIMRYMNLLLTLTLLTMTLTLTLTFRHVTYDTWMLLYYVHEIVHGHAEYTSSIHSNCRLLLIHNYYAASQYYVRLRKTSRCDEYCYRRSSAVCRSVCLSVCLSVIG